MINLSRLILSTLIVIVTLISINTLPSPAYAIPDDGNRKCSTQNHPKYEILPRDPKCKPVPNKCKGVCNCRGCEPTIQNNHMEIRNHMTEEFIKHRNWMIDELFTKHILPAMMLMTSQLSVIAVQQVQMIGAFFDAKHQLETQRLFQQLMAEAHKDYQPSEGLCEIGTNVRSLAASSRKSDLVHVAFANRVMSRQLRNGAVASAGEENSDINSRLKIFKEKNCNKNDNSGGLALLCASSSTTPNNGGGGGDNNGGDGDDGGSDSGAVIKKRANKDVNFSKTLGASVLTLDIDFTDNGSPTPDEEDVFSLTANLFAHTVFPAISKDILATKDGEPRAAAYRYMDLRSIAAKRSVAQNSIAAMVAERAKGDKEVAKFLKKLVTELGVKETEVEDILGKEPSYYAQMEVLTKNIYQNPVFFTELYDKPANVLRKGATIRALNLMQERDLYESQLRSEATLSIILETMLMEEHNRVNALLGNLKSGGKK